MLQLRTLLFQVINYHNKVSLYYSFFLPMTPADDLTILLNKICTADASANHNLILFRPWPPLRKGVFMPVFNGVTHTKHDDAY